MTQGAGGGRRSRIVIDVSRAQEEARKKKGGRFRSVRRYLSVSALIVIGVLIVVLVAGYVWWRGFEKSPAYSLALLVDAAQRDDKQAVDSLINADTIAQGFIPQMMAKLTGQDSPLTPQARAQLTNVMPQLLPRVRETMRDEIAQDVKEFAGKPGQPVVVTALGIRGKSQTEESGDDATVRLAAPDRQVELAMRRDGERWRVVNVKDERLASAIAARLAANIPANAPAPQQAQPRRKGR